MKELKTYFVTGATGTIGSAIIPELVALEYHQIYLLIRADDSAHLDQRFGELCDYWGLPLDVIHKIIPIKGDLDLLNFGIDEPRLSNLFKDVTHIIHSAGNVRMNLSVKESRQESVSVTKRVLAFSRNCQSLRKIDFVSTIGVAGKMLSGIVEEPLVHQKGFHNNYEAAKYEAELLLWDSIKAGLPITIHRPSMVVGHSETGKIANFQVFYFLMEFLNGKQTMGFLPELKSHKVDIVPVDFVAKAIVIASGDVGTIGRVFHLCSGHKAAPLKTLVSISNRLNDYPSNKIRYISSKLFKNALKLLSIFLSEKDRRKVKALPYFLSYLERKQVFENDLSLQYFESRHLILKPFEHYISNLMFYFNQNKLSK